MEAETGRDAEECSKGSNAGQFIRKRQRIGSSSQLPSGAEDELEILKADNGTSQGEYVFNDPKAANVLLTFSSSGSSAESPKNALKSFYLHSQVLVQCRYFQALLSHRWQDSRPKIGEESYGAGDELMPIIIGIPSAQDLAAYVTAIRLLYSGDFMGVITDVQTSLAVLPVATELLFDECITACVSFLETVPWNKDEEKQISRMVTHLQLKEASSLLARLGPVHDNAVEEMLNGMVYTATHSQQSISVSVKTFVAHMLSNHGSRETVRVVLERAFASSLKTVKDSVEEYSNPNVRGRYDEIEALQRQNLHTAVVNGRSLLWIVERMIELRVAKTAVTEWSEQDAFTANLKRAFSEDTWRNIAPGLPALVLRCTSKLTSAVAAGSIVVSSQVRLKLVNDWLPVLVVSRENGISATQNKQLHQELENVFLRVILTLPILDAQKLLQQCLSFATRTVEECPHLVKAFNTWFRRASQQKAIFSDEDGFD